MALILVFKGVTLFNDAPLSVPPKILAEGPLTQSVILGESAQLPCEASGVPPPKIFWQKGTRVLSTSMGWSWSSFSVPRICADTSTAVTFQSTLKCQMDP